MKTIVAHINTDRPNSQILAKAADIIKKGGLVAFPTETVYGLGANALNESAVKKIFLAKKRPQDNPLITHISDLKQLQVLVTDINPLHQKLMDFFWPGPLTLLFNKKSNIPSVVTAGLATITVRFPSHPIARELIRLSGVPIAAPSANLSGKPSPTYADHVIEDLSGAVDMILDAGPTTYGVESTVIDPLHNPPRILRSGVISIEQIKLLLPDIINTPHTINSTVPLSPGMKYRHYAPNARVIILKKNSQKEIEEIMKNNSVAVSEVSLITNSTLTIPGLETFQFSSLDALSKELFNIFRLADKKNKKVIMVENLSKKGIGKTLMDRLQKASTGFPQNHL